MIKEKTAITKTCEYCNNDFVVSESYARHNPARFCSNKCRMQWRGKELQSAMVYPERIKRECERCGIEFSVQPNAMKKAGGGKYCSLACRKNRVDKTCKECGKAFEIQVCEERWGQGSFCGIECKSAWQSANVNGRNHPNYLGDDYQREYPNVFNAVKDAIRERDKRTCQVCGVSENGKKLCVHHIDYDKNNTAPNNLITLCPSCHAKTNFRHDTWIAKFTPMIGVPA